MLNGRLGGTTMSAGTDTEFTLKRLTSTGVAGALAKAERYRLLNEPRQAESICRDVLDVEPQNQAALVMLLLSLTDQFPSGRQGCLQRARAVLEELSSGYERAYYDGVIKERHGKAILDRHALGSGAVAHEWLTKAMEAYEAAHKIHPAGNEDALLRWNTCARMIMEDTSIRPESDALSLPTLE